jgi:hypothetical protein
MCLEYCTIKLNKINENVLELIKHVNRWDCTGLYWNTAENIYAPTHTCLVSGTH